MNKDPALTTFVWLIGAFLCVGLATVIGVFVVLPLGALFIIYLIVSKINAPKEMSNEELHKLATAEFPTDEAFLDSFIDKMLSRREYTVWQVTREVCGIAHVFYNAESFGVGPLLKFTPGSIYEGRYRDRLMAAQEKAADAKKTVEAFSEILFDAVHGFNKTLPALAKDERYFTSTAPKPPTTVPLIDVLPDVHETIAALTEPFFSEKAKSLDLFKGVRESLEENQEALKKSKPDSQRKFVEAALKGTARNPS